MPFEQTVAVPRTSDYGPGLADFSPIANAPNTYYQGVFNQQQKATNDQQQQLNQQRIQQGQQQLDLAKTFQGGIPRDAQGNPDYGKIAAMLAQKGDIGALTQMAPLIQQGQAGNTPLYGGVPGPAGGGAPQSAGGPQPGPAPASVQARPLPAPSPNSPQGDSGTGSVTSLVTDRLPSQNLTTGQTILKIAQVMGIDPNADLTPGQQRRAQGLLNRYAPQIAGPASNSGNLPPSANAVSPRPDSGAGDNAGREGAPGGMTSGAPAPAAPQQGGGGQPLTPQVPLPPGFTDPMQAINGLRDRAAKLEAANPKTTPIAERLRAQADQIEKSLQPVPVGASTTLLDPRTGKPLYQGPAAAAYGSSAENSTTLDADAARYRQTGTLPPNMGRGIQGQQQATAIRTRAAEQEVAEGGDPSKWADRWQEYKAKGVGLSAEARVGATREANLKIILRAADAAVPAALEQSEKVWRTGFVPLNKIIQHGEIATSDPELRAFGMANLQLAEHWARAMNPTGVMRESDREKALEFLNTADSPKTYRRLIEQLQTQIKRELGAVQGGKASNDVPAPGKLSTEQKAAPAGKLPKAEGTTKSGLQWSVE